MSKIVVLVDDERDFADGREAIVARSSNDAITLTDELVFVDELWLDFSLAGMDDVMAFLWHLVARFQEGNPLVVGKVVFHSSAYGAMDLIKTVGGRAGLPEADFPVNPATRKLVN